MDNLILKFKNEALKPISEFTLESDRYTYTFMKRVVGNCTYVYGNSVYDSSDLTRLDLKFTLVAFVAYSKVYIFDRFFFGYHVKQEDLPDKVHFFDDLQKKVNNKVRNVLFPKYVNNLPVNKTNEEYCKSLLKDARRLLFSSTPISSAYEYVYNHSNFLLKDRICMKDNDIVKLLCGFTVSRSVINERLEKERDGLIEIKTEGETIINLMNSPTTAKEWEIELAEGLRSVDAKMVTVEFHYKGNTACAKISPDNIRRTLTCNGYFEDYDFSSRTAGVLLFKSLGADDGYRSDNHLLCEHIFCITYGKNVLFKRK